MGLISKIFSWGIQPLNDETTWQQWGAALVLILMASFLWATVVKQTID